jgi:uncharacterized membrane protein YeaQ/YmgE (transglycosylase-associated protein family)
MPLLRATFQRCWLRLGRRITVSIIGCLVIGLIVGFIGSKIVNETGRNLLLDSALGMVGAMVCGFCISLIDAAPVNGLDIYGMFVAAIGAIVVLIVYHDVISRRDAIRERENLRTNNGRERFRSA